MEKILVKSGRIFLSVMFIFSGVSKLISLPFFDGLVAGLLIGPDYYDHYEALWYVQVLTRVIISSELLLGAALLQEIQLKKIVLPVTQFLLLVFTAHLFYEGFRSGFVDGNCGCFGDVLPMTNLESIIKNVVAMLVVAFVWWKHVNRPYMRFASWVMPFLLGLITLLTLWMTIKDYTPTEPSELPGIIQEDIKPQVELINLDTSALENKDSIIEDKTSIESEKIIKTTTKEEKTSIVKEEKEVQKEEQTKTPTPLEITKGLLKKYTKFSDGSILNVEKEEQIVCMFSMTCGHCQEVYKDICGISQYAKFPKLFLFNFGQEFEQNYFFNQAGPCKDAHIRIDDYNEFMRLLEGKSFPRILVFKDGKIVKTWDIDTYSKESFLNYYGIEEKTVKPSNELDLGTEGETELDF